MVADPPALAAVTEGPDGVAAGVGEGTTVIQMSTVGPMFGQFVHYLRFAPAGNDYSKSRYQTQAVRVTEAAAMAAGRWVGRVRWMPIWTTSRSVKRAPNQSSATRTFRGKPGIRTR